MEPESAALGPVAVGYGVLLPRFEGSVGVPVETTLRRWTRAFVGIVRTSAVRPRVALLGNFEASGSATGNASAIYWHGLGRGGQE